MGNTIFSFVQSGDYKQQEIEGKYLICYADTPSVSKVSVTDSEIIVTVNGLDLTTNESGVLSVSDSEETAWLSAYDKFQNGLLPERNSWQNILADSEVSKQSISGTPYLVVTRDGKPTRRAKNAKGLLESSAIVSADAEMILEQRLASLKILNNQLAETQRMATEWTTALENRADFKVLVTVLFEAEKAYNHAKQAVESYLSESDTQNPYYETIESLTKSKQALINQINLFLP